MKTIKAYIVFIWILASGTAFGMEPDKQEPEWPKQLITEEAEIKIYQPQINALEGDMLDARAAISIKKKGESMVFGAMWFKSRLVTDFDTRLVDLKDVKVESVKFPEADEADEERMINLLESEIPAMDLTYSLDRLLTSLEMVEKNQAFSEQLNNKAPKIYFEDEAAVLILIDGEPILEDIENTKLQYVINTPYFIIYNTSDLYYYLKGGDWWYRAGRLEDTWREIASPPVSVLEIAKQTEGAPDSDVDSIARTLEYPPKIVLSKEPAELIITDGEPDFATLEGTSLLYVRNTENEILMDINTQDYYVLIAGRWYKSRSLDQNDWVFVSPDDLSADFAKIETESEMGSVRSSVPGTRESNEALLENQIPQTAEVDRNTATVDVSYDGNPEFGQIKGTKMAYAMNTDKSVLLIDNRYYCVDNAVWFESASPTGPWTVCVVVPEQVQEIPPEYPVYNVKYVYVYDYTPSVVYVGYTPGYVYSYPYHGTIVYGTGYYYRPWHRRYYYPRPVTYGYGVHYNPYTGWGFSVGVSYGWVGYNYYRSPYYYTSWWGPAGYSCGYRHGYYNGYNRGYYRGYYYGYDYGVYTYSRSGYNAGYHDGYHRATSQNIYKSRPTGVVHTRTRATTYGSRTAANATRSSYSKPGSVDRKNNVYTDRNGAVYRKKGDSWQTRESGSWKKSDVAGTVTPNSDRRTQSTSSTATRTTTTSTTTKTTTTRNTGSSSASRSSQGSTYSRSGMSNKSNSGRELSRESVARSHGSQRTYTYQKSQQPTKNSTTSRSSSTSSKSAAARSTPSGSSSRSKSSTGDPRKR
jgi:hypothetical protein